MSGVGFEPPTLRFEKANALTTKPDLSQSREGLKSDVTQTRKLKNPSPRREKLNLSYRHKGSN